MHSPAEDNDSTSTVAALTSLAMEISSFLLFRAVIITSAKNDASIEDNGQWGATRTGNKQQLPYTLDCEFLCRIECTCVLTALSIRGLYICEDNNRYARASNVKRECFTINRFVEETIGE